MAGRRPGPARRILLQVPWARLAAAAGLLAVSWGLYWVTTDATFAVDARTIPIEGERYTSEAAVRDAIDLPEDRAVNIFRIATRDIESRIERLPAVRAATVTATLPDRVRVAIVERSPMLAWRVGQEGWLIDGDGVLFAPASLLDAAELGDGASGSRLPAVDDRRNRAAPAIGERVDPLDLAVVRLLATVTPAMLGSRAPALFLSVDDEDGYVLEAPGTWRASFGFYTPVLRPPDLIPRQVQCLGALLAREESTLGEVTLSLAEDACGTYRVRPTGRPGGRPDRPNATAAPRRTPGSDGVRP